MLPSHYAAKQHSVVMPKLGAKGAESLLHLVAGVEVIQVVWKWGCILGNWLIVRIDMAVSLFFREYPSIGSVAGVAFGVWAIVKPALHQDEEPILATRLSDDDSLCFWFHNLESEMPGCDCRRDVNGDENQDAGGDIHG